MTDKSLVEYLFRRYTNKGIPQQEGVALLLQNCKTGVGDRKAVVILKPQYYNDEAQKRANAHRASDQVYK